MTVCVEVVVFGRSPFGGDPLAPSSFLPSITRLCARLLVAGLPCEFESWELADDRLLPAPPVLRP